MVARKSQESSSYAPNIWIKIAIVCFCVILYLDDTHALEWSLRDQYDVNNNKIRDVLYPPRKCFKKRLIFHKDKSKQVEQTKHWSLLFNHNWFPLNDFHTRNRNPEFYNKNAVPKSFVESFAVVLWVIFMVIFYCLSIFFVPLMGLFIFKLFWLCSMLLANAKTRYACRWIVIHFQRFKRNNEYYITPEGRKPLQFRFRMPKIFREDSDEDVPPILREPPSSDFSEANSEDEVCSSAEEMLMEAAYGMQVVKRPKWRPPNAPPDTHHHSHIGHSHSHSHSRGTLKKRHTIVCEAGFFGDDEYESETSKTDLTTKSAEKD